MSKDKEKVKFKSRVACKDSAEIIDALSAALRDGHIKVQKNDKALHLVVPEFVDIEIEACLENDKAKFEIELSWPAANKQTAVEENCDQPGSGKCATTSKEKAKESAKAAVHSAQEALKEVGKVFALSGKTAGKALLETVEATKTAVKDSAKAAKEMAEQASVKLKDTLSSGEDKLQEFIDTHPDLADSKKSPPKPKKVEEQKSLPASKNPPKSLSS